MSDDYLWDGSGEPDFEAQQLERTLRTLGYRRRPFKSPTVRRPDYSYRLAAAAALLLAACGLWFLSLRPDHDATTPSPVAAGASGAAEPRGAEGQPKREDGIAAVDLRADSRMAAGKRAAHNAANRPQRRAKEAADVRRLRDDSGGERASVRPGPPWSDPLFRAEAARHMEKVQLLLRAFRNMPVPQGEAGESRMALSYEREQSKQLLSKTIFLRREAEARGNLPMIELLERIEPFLTDIANLQSVPRQDEMRSIKELMRKQEIIAMLQVCSTESLGEDL
jgi:hypothetical protein